MFENFIEWNAQGECVSVCELKIYAPKRKTKSEMETDMKVACAWIFSLRLHSLRLRFIGARRSNSGERGKDSFILVHAPADILHCRQTWDQRIKEILLFQYNLPVIFKINFLPKTLQLGNQKEIILFDRSVTQKNTNLIEQYFVLHSFFCELIPTKNLLAHINYQKNLCFL
jgi:hypothetical protein